MAAVLVTGLTPAVDEHALREFFSYRRARTRLHMPRAGAAHAHLRRGNALTFALCAAQR
jgi:hypothetical protein